MALTEVGALMFPQVSAVGAVTTRVIVLDAAGEMAGVVLQIPKSGNVAKVGFWTWNYTAGDTVAAGLYTIDAATGFPVIAAPYGGMVAGTRVVAASTTAYTVTLSTPAAVVGGDTIAVVLSFPAYGAGNFQVFRNSDTMQTGLPYSVAEAGAGWVKTPNPMVTWLEYSDGSYGYIPGVLQGRYSSSAFKQDTAGADEYGLLFTAPCNMRVSGWWAQVLPGAASEVVLYSGTTELTKATLDNDVTQATGTANQMLGQFPASVDLVAGQQYRVTLRPSDGVANSNLYHLLTPSAAAMNAMPMGTDAIGTSRLNLGAWVDMPTYRPQIGVVASHVDDDAECANELLTRGVGAEDPAHLLTSGFGDFYRWSSIHPLSDNGRLMTRGMGAGGTGYLLTAGYGEFDTHDFVDAGRLLVRGFGDVAAYQLTRGMGDFSGTGVPTGGSGRTRGMLRGIVRRFLWWS